MKRYFVLSIITFLCVSLNAQLKWNSRYQAYIDQYKDLAIAEMLKYNIPASITLAQGLLESGAGMSELARNGNNHFGIKCHDWTGGHIMTTMPITNVSGHTATCTKAMKTIAGSLLVSRDTAAFSG